MHAFIYSDSSAIHSLINKATSMMTNPKVTKVDDVTDISVLISHADRDSVFFLDWDNGAIIAEKLIKQIKSYPKFVDLPVIILVSKNKSNTMTTDVQRLAAAVLMKPINAPELVTTVQKVTRPVGASSNVDVSFVNPFIAATKSVFEKMGHTKADRKDLFLKKDYKMFGDVSGVMGLVGRANGSVVLSLPRQTACKVVARMLGEEDTGQLTESIKDGVGEIVNIIAGQAKAALAQTQHHFTLSIPTVVSGAGHEIMHKKGAPCIVIVFDAEGDLFALQVCLAGEMA